MQNFFKIELIVSKKLISGPERACAEICSSSLPVPHAWRFKADQVFLESVLFRNAGATLESFVGFFCPKVSASMVLQQLSQRSDQWKPSQQGNLHIYHFPFRDGGG